MVVKGRTCKECGMTANKKSRSKKRLAIGTGSLFARALSMTMTQSSLNASLLMAKEVTDSGIKEQLRNN